MIAFSKISKQYAKQILFVETSFQLNPGEKVGLVGPNVGEVQGEYAHQGRLRPRGGP